MADQVGSGTMSGAMDSAAGYGPGTSDVAPAGALPAGEHPHFSGRPVSWVAVVIIIIGFLIGGIALVAGTVWPLFWVGVGVVVAGGILAMSIGIFNDWY
jgi:ABC-type multidrug transport system permease subunit